MNRSQRRRQQSRQRGVGFTRQFSSRRARLQHGTDQKLSRKYVELLKAIREALKAQSAKPLSLTDEFVLHSDGSVSGTKVETFDLLGEDVPFIPEELLPEEWELLDGYLESSAKDLASRVSDGNFDSILNVMRSREEDHKSRVTVLKAIDARMKILGESFVYNAPDVSKQTSATELAAR